MKLTAKLTGDEIKLNIVDVLNGMSNGSKQRLIEILSCEETIIKHVTDQILIGMTENGMRGVDGRGETEPITALAKARRRIAKDSSKQAEDEIEDLEQSLADSEDRRKKLRGEIVKEYRKLKKLGYHKPI